MPTYTITVVVNTAGAQRSLNQLGQAGINVDRILGMIGATVGAKRVIELSDAYTTLQNKLRTVTDGEIQLQDVTEKTFQIAQNNRVAWDGLAQTYARLKRSTEDLGLSQQEALDITDTVAKAIKLSGATANETRSVLLQLSQAFAAGKLNGDEFRSVMENSVEIGNLLAKSLGVTRGELKEMSKAGKITTEVMIRAFQGAREEMVKRFGESIPTIAERFQQLKNQAEKMVGEWAKNSQAAATFGDGVAFVTRNLDEFAKVIMAIAIPAVLAFTVALLANPVFAAAAALTAVTIGVIALAEELEGTKEEQDAYSEALEASNGNMFLAVEAAQKAAESHMFFNRVVKELHVNVFELTAAWAHNITTLARVDKAIKETSANLQVARIFAATGGRMADGAKVDGSVFAAEKKAEIERKNREEAAREAERQRQEELRMEREMNELRETDRLQAAEQFKQLHGFAPSVSRLGPTVDFDSLVTTDLSAVTENMRKEAEAQKAVLDDMDKQYIEFEKKRQKEHAAAIERGDLNADGMFSAAEGMKVAFRDISKEAMEAGDVVQQAFEAAFKRSEDALAKFIRTGEFSFEEFTNAILDDLAKIIARQVLVWAVSSIGSAAAGSTAGAAGAGGAAVAAFAQGGDFFVGGHGGTDSQLVAFRASPNEHVSIRTPQQRRAELQGSNGRDGVTIVNITDPRAILSTLSSPEGQRQIRNAQRLMGAERQTR